MSLFQNVTGSPGSWLSSTNEESDIVLSCRIRLARNLRKIKFPEYMSSNDAEKIKESIKSAIPFCPALTNPELYEMNKLPNLERLILIERHLISKQLAGKKDGMLIVNADEKLSVMINEEDHFRIQVIDAGLQLTKIWEIINTFDNQLEKQLDFAFSANYGYLTACPTNVGTGMRCSILAHLPGIIMINQLNKIQGAIEKLGLIIRGYYGEGTEASGNFFQISNQFSLGKNEESIIEKIDNIGRQIVEHEKNTRKILLQESRTRVEDQIFRAYGILTNARILSSNESMALLSMIRLGVNTGIIPTLTVKKLNEALVFSQPGHLQKILGKEISAEKRDFFRAQMIREKFLN